MQFSAKTVDEAIKLGLSELNITLENADVIILEEPTKGLFGRLKGKAVIDMVAKEVSTPKKQDKKECSKKKEQPAKKQAIDNEQTKDNSDKTMCFVDTILKMLDNEANLSKSFLDNKLIITVDSKDSSSLIGRRGEVLDAIQTLAGAYENIGNKVYKKVVVDCENYRTKREDSLISLAKRLEQKATEMRREVILEPMGPYERRIIHTALAESETVTTKSNGKEPNRYVVIVPNDLDEFARPYNAARNNERRSNGKGGNDRRKGGKFNRNGRANDRKPSSNGGAPKKKTITFGTYLGNSKDI